jgi:hypothetical protein
MRRLTGILDGTTYVITEYDSGMVECPSVLIDRLRADRYSAFPTGAALTAACQQLFGATLQIRILPASREER